MLASHDLDDYFTTSQNWVTRLLVRYADYTGTSYDPKLVVEHATAAFGTTTIQNITYAYDPVGNITTITDQGGTDAQHTAAYSYDELDRLLAASTTAASTTPFRLTFSYDALGNITGTRLNGGATTTYSYAGTSYANPHAVTSFGATSYSYDNNGNVTSAGSSSYTWDYLNRITQSVVNGTTTSYGYDHLGSRMFQTVGSTTTRYPSRLFSVASYANGATTTATSTEYIYLGDMLLATIDQRAVNGTATGTPTITYSHPDHLGSTAVMTDAGAAVTQALDYYPYGGARVSSGGSTNKRQYIGEFADGSGLSYLNARYYDSARGQFMGQDPVFWEIGLSRDGKSVLANPQALNSYGYGNSNPVAKKDPTGRCPWCLPFLVGGAAGGFSQYAADVMTNRAAGITGMAAFSPRSSWQEYNTAIAFGAGAAATAVFSLPAAGLVSMVGSGVGDVAGERDIDPGKAVFTGAGTVATGGFFKWGAGASPAEIYMQAMGRSFNSMPTAVFKNEIRYGTANETFGSSVNAIIQSRYQTTQKYNAGLANGAGSAPHSNSLWVTPSGAIVTFSAQLMVGPVAQSTPATIRN